MICVIGVYDYENHTVLDIEHSVEAAKSMVERVAAKVGVVNNELGYEIWESGTKPKRHLYASFEGKWFWETETAVGGALKSWRAARRAHHKSARSIART